MAGFPTSGVGTHYGDTSIAEDVSQIIFQITPDDTPFWQMSGETSSSGSKHEWQRRNLTTRQVNALGEGFTYTFPTQMTLPTRVFNFNQIIGKEIRVSNSQGAITHHAIADAFADQMMVRMTEWKTDGEHALIQGTLVSGEATAGAQNMQGIINAIVSNASTYTTGGGSRTLSESAFNDFIQTSWDLGGEPRDVLVNGRAKRALSQFTASDTKFIPSTEQRVVNTISVYESDFFPVNIALSRDIPSTTASGVSILFVDRTMVNKAWLRRPVSKRVPETADSTDGVIVGELTLEFGNASAHAYALAFVPIL